MRVTCDTSCNMGYIYIRDRFNHQFTASNSLRDQFEPEKLEVKQVDDIDFSNLLMDMIIMNTTYLDAIENGEVIEEYLNDKDSDGNFWGIELNLSMSYLEGQINDYAFKVFEGFWNDDEYFLVTFECSEVVFTRSTRIYPLNEQRDTFILCSPRLKGQGDRIYGILSNRSDIYDLTYFKQIDFVVY